MTDNNPTVLERLQAEYDYWCKVEDKTFGSFAHEHEYLDAKGRAKGIKQAMDIINADYASCGCRVKG